MGLGPEAARTESAARWSKPPQFGTNPGDLRMFSFVPPDLRPHRPALVVVLHGCGQTAAGYDLGAGWSTLAKHYGFALLMPEQQASNNAHTCFNWFNPEDTKRDHGEACSIRQMIARMVASTRIDKHRIFITGLSAGGAMTSVMLATYPEVFAAGAIIAGLPFGVAGQRARSLERHDAVARAPGRGTWATGAQRFKASSALAEGFGMAWQRRPHRQPRQCQRDRQAVARRASSAVAPMSEGTVDGYPRQIWWNADGETVVESYTITDMAHGTPLGTAENDQRYRHGRRVPDRGRHLLLAITSQISSASPSGIPKPKAASRESPARS